MSIKKILTAATASVLAVTAMSVVASAEEKTVELVIPMDGTWHQEDLDGAKLGVDVSKIETIKVTSANASTGDALAAMTVVYKDATITDAKVGDNIDTATINGSDMALDENFWLGIGTGWDGSGWADDGMKVTLTITLADDAAADTTPADSTPADDATSADATTSTTDTTDKKDNVDTGVAGVAAVVGVAVVAAGAMVVAKKRK